MQVLSCSFVKAVKKDYLCTVIYMIMESVQTNSIKAWILAARPKTLAAAATPVLLGCSLAHTDGMFQIIPAILCFLFAFTMQIDANFINDFITGRSKFDRMPVKSKLPTNVVSAFRVFDLGISATWREVGVKYRALAKKYHPDTATDKENAATEFAKISTAYDLLKKHFGKK